MGMVHVSQEWRAAGTSQTCCFLMVVLKHSTDISLIYHSLCRCSMGKRLWPLLRCRIFFPDVPVPNGVGNLIAGWLLALSFWSSEHKGLVLSSSFCHSRFCWRSHWEFCRLYKIWRWLDDRNFRHKVHERLLNSRKCSQQRCRMDRFDHSKCRHLGHGVFRWHHGNRCYCWRLDDVEVGLTDSMIESAGVSDMICAAGAVMHGMNSIPYCICIWGDKEGMIHHTTPFTELLYYFSLIC
jgi:hypothetical protein